MEVVAHETFRLTERLKVTENLKFLLSCFTVFIFNIFWGISIDSDVT